ncbi:hypothetical protein [Amycolatopsis japonica]
MRAKLDRIARFDCSAQPGAPRPPHNNLLALQRAAGNRAVNAAVQRQVTFKSGGQQKRAIDVRAEDLQAAFAAREFLHPEIPRRWGEPSAVRLTALRGALAALDESVHDHGLIDLDDEAGVTALCQALIAIAESGEKPVSGLRYPKMNAEVITRKTRAGIELTLTKWHDYAKKWVDDASEEHSEWTAARNKLGNQYYEDTAHEDFRKQYKAFMTTYEHMDGVIRECSVLLVGLKHAGKEELRRFRAVYKAEALQAVVEWEDETAGHIENIVSNPHNLTPANEHHRVPGAAAAVLALTVLRNRAHHGGSGQDITLITLNNKVKAIYDRYYFRVRTEENRIYERPKRGERKRKDDGRLKPAKTPWHKEDSMVLTPTMADRLLGDVQPNEWLTTPTDLDRDHATTES